MSNVGLKTYTKQLVESLDNGSTAYINLNSNDANIIIEIPLFQTFGERPIDLSLIYNHNDLTNPGCFGLGSRLNILKSISISGSTITITNSDGSKDDYTCYGVMNKETNMKMMEIPEGIRHYDLVDKYNNRYVYESTNAMYPKRIKKGSELKYSFIESGGKLSTISNGFGDEISFYYASNYVSCIAFKHYGIIKYKTYFLYSNNRIFRIQTKRVEGQTETLFFDTNLLFSSSNIVLKNQFNNNCRIEFLLNSGKVVKFNKYEESNNYETNIEYIGNRTKVTDYLGLESNTIFSNDFPAYEINNIGKLIYREYDFSTKKLLKESTIKNIYQQETSLISPNLFDYTNTGLNVENYIESNAFYNSFLDNIYKVSGTGRLSKTLLIEGLASDNLSLIVFGKMLSTTTDSSYVEIRLNYNNTSKFKKITIDNNYEMISIGEVVENSYNRVEVSIWLYGNASVALGGLCLSKRDFGSLYSYDNIGNVQDESTGHGNIQREYYSYNLPKTYVGIDSTCYNFKYDNDDNIIECKTAYGAKINKTYSNNHPTSNTVINGLGNKGLYTQSAYSSGRLISYASELGNITTFNNDSFGRLQKVINALGEMEEYAYDDLNNIINYKRFNQNDEVEMIYTYDTKNRITSATLANGSIYSFSYDSNGNVSSILLNNSVVYSFEYDVKNFPVKIKNGNTSIGYTFTYNDDYMLDSIYYYNSSNVSELRYKYIYNEKKQLYRVLDGNNTIIKEYAYDLDGKVIGISYSTGDIYYQYNHLGEVSNRKRDIIDSTLHEGYDSISRSKGSNPEAIIPFICGNSKYVSGIFNEDSSVLLGNNIGYDVSDNIGISYGKDKIIPYVQALNGLTYYTYPSLNQPCGSVAYWFKPSVSLNGKVLFCVKRPSDLGYGLIKVEVVNNKLKLSVIDISNITYQVLTTENSVELNKWNFFSVIFFKRYDELGPYVSEFALTLNEKTSINRFQNPWINYEIGQAPEYHIGANYDGTLSIVSPITCLAIGYKNNMSLGDLEKYYRCTKDYIIENLLDDSYDVVNLSNTTLHTFDQSILSSFEIYPLQNNVTSLNGLKPKKFNLRKTSKYDKDRTFNYNKLIKHYAYVADGEELVYDLNISRTGTIMLRAYTDGHNSKQFFFEAKDVNNHRIGLYRGENGIIFIKIDEASIATNIPFSSNTWHTIGLSFDENNPGESIITTTKYLRLYLDERTYEFSMNLNHSYSYLSLMVGRSFDEEEDVTNIGVLSNCNALLGQIEMLSLRGAYCSIALLNQLKNALVDINKISLYDDLGMIKRSIIHKSGNEILSNTYTYKVNSDLSTNDITYISNVLEAENIMYGNQSTTIGYGIDDLERITSISSSTFSNGHSYTYDYRGFLVLEDDIVYSYDDNGNILTAGNDIFMYDPVIKDRLKYVNNIEVVYSLNNPLLPETFGNASYGFEGKKLVNYSDNLVNISFQYDENGYIIERTDNDTGIISNYIYDNNKLITEIKENIRNDYLYDENNKLYGFIQNGVNVYYYVRDSRGNILGIVDNNGILVVKYNYDAYGHNISHTGTNIYIIHFYIKDIIMIMI